MNIFISGISGTGLGPLALMAHSAGFGVSGSDLAEGAVSRELAAAGIEFETGKQDGKFLQKKFDEGKVDWFVYTSALPKNHPELKLAQKLGLRVSKRDELIAYLVEKMGLKMVAVAGTHGKTTTTSMIVWVALNLGLPVSYLVGTTLPFAEAGKYDKRSEFLIYEADEYDRNFLHFFPWLSVITTVSYDHPDIYPTRLDYMQAFAKFESQSEQVIRGRELEGAAVSANEDTLDFSRKFRLAGKARRYDASLAMQAIFEMVEEVDMQRAEKNIIAGGKDYAGREINEDLIIDILNDFPGVGRRFERISDGVYSDYGHHPEEIAATVEIAKEEAELTGKDGVVVIYEPHQNTRQHEVFDGYKDAFSGVQKLYWLPTYLTRENPDLKVLTPADFIASLSNEEIGEPAEMNGELAKKITDYREKNKLILLMTAGPADKWLREVIK
ncbi:hypothetical protein J6D24_00115 [Candidatus Saccharibacteria bacterium]|nr:hypothetical protein [Candidatus Saccharibacteria bacterium]